jgi:hypothetical protein
LLLQQQHKFLCFRIGLLHILIRGGNFSLKLNFKLHKPKIAQTFWKIAPVLSTCRHLVAKIYFLGTKPATSLPERGSSASRQTPPTLSLAVPAPMSKLTVYIYLYSQQKCSCIIQKKITKLTNYINRTMFKMLIEGINKR